MSNSYSFKNQEMIYITGWGSWGRVLNQTEHDVQLYVDGYPAKWYPKSKIVNLINSEEPASCE